MHVFNCCFIQKGCWVEIKPHLLKWDEIFHYTRQIIDVECISNTISYFQEDA